MCFFRKKKKEKALPFGTKHIYLKEKLEEHKALLLKDMLESVPGVSCNLGNFQDIVIFVKAEVKLSDIEDKIKECKIKDFKII